MQGEGEGGREVEQVEFYLHCVYTLCAKLACGAISSSIPACKRGDAFVWRIISASGASIFFFLSTNSANCSGGSRSSRPGGWEARILSATNYVFASKQLTHFHVLSRWESWFLSLVGEDGGGPWRWSGARGAGVLPHGCARPPRRTGPGQTGEWITRTVDISTWIFFMDFFFFKI